jgi:hypothetical protein
MGTWDDGLYDNDSSLDTHGRILDSLSLEKSPAHLATGIGLQLWLHPVVMSVSPEKTTNVIRAHLDWVAAFPEPVRAAMLRIADDPRAEAEREAGRSEEVHAILGSYSGGVRETTLLQCDGAAAVIEELATICQAHLDRVHADWPDLHRLAGDLGALGMLIELRELGARTTAGSVDRWEVAFDRADRATEIERDFWNAYVRRAKAGFALLRTAPCCGRPHE